MRSREGYLLIDHRVGAIFARAEAMFASMLTADSIRTSTVGDESTRSSSADNEDIV